MGGDPVSIISSAATLFSSARSIMGSGEKKSSPAPAGPAPTTQSDSVAQEAERRRREAQANAMGRGATIATTPFNQQIAGAVQRKALLGE